jgi:hypothetical protein
MSLRATKYLQAVPDVNIILKMYFFDKQWKWDWPEIQGNGWVNIAYSFLEIVKWGNYTRTIKTV